MKKRMKAFLMAMVMLFSVVASAIGDVAVYMADDELVLKLHYERTDGDYTDWNVWFWETGAEGASYELEEVNGERVATKVVTPGTAQVGYIVKKGDWVEKDVAADQFIDVTKYVSGTIHVYVKSGVEGHQIVEENAVTGTKLLSASYDQSKNRIEAKISGDVEDKDNAFKVCDAAGKEVSIKLVETSGSSYLITLADELDLTSNYTITFAEKTYNVTMPNIYSTSSFEEEYTYTGDDLGATWTKEATTFRLWAPLASAVKVNLYKSGTEGTNDLIEQIEMKADVNGTWVATKSGDQNGVYYTYSVTNNGEEVEACDPYARTTGVNGKRAMIIDLDSTDPKGWENDKNPHAGETINDAIIYELHIRDLSTDKNSGIENVGKYLGLTEHGTKTSGGMSTGIDHIKELGITHLHILPMYDYGSVDESKLDTSQFNWGYDPVNYNVPEGSYSTDPYNGEVRVSEVKQMVQSLHNDGISVVMDVVYNHVYSAENFCFNKIVPMYFSRADENGNLSSGSGCGNDTASERAMVKKYIVDSVKYWADEYHIDGFRFDLVGLIDTETINEIITEVHKTHPDVIFYGEGWTMSTQLTKDGYTLTTQTNSEKVPGFAFFSDTIRDVLKGSVFNIECGYVSGAAGKESIIESCFIGLAGSWCKSPSQSVNYASCHDNYTLFDVLQQARKDAEFSDIVKMNNLAAAIYMTAQGVPFMQAGEEMLRTKVKEDGSFDHNSYSSSDAINSLKWDTLDDASYQSVFEYYKGLIAFRKAHAALRLTDSSAVAQYMTVLKGLDSNVTGFSIKGGMEGETAKEIYIIFNANEDAKTVTLPEGNWNVYVKGDKAGTKVLETVSGTIDVEAISALILVQEDSASVSPIVVPVVVGVVAGVAIIGISTFYVMKMRKEAGL